MDLHHGTAVETSDARASWPAIVGLLLSIAGWIVSATIVYGTRNTDGWTRMGERITTVETHAADVNRRLDELRGDMREMNGKIDRLLGQAQR